MADLSYTTSGFRGLRSAVLPGAFLALLLGLAPGLTAVAGAQTAPASQSAADKAKADADAKAAKEKADKEKADKEKAEAAQTPVVGEEITVTARKREETLQDVPFSVAAPTEEVLRDRGVESIEGVAANVAGFTVQNLGPGPEPGRHARRLLRPDRARPAGRQGAGRRLPRRVGDLALAVHARPRPLRRGPRRGAARTAGHALRLRLAVGHGALHHQPAGARASATSVGELGANAIDGRRHRRQRQGGRATCRSATTRRCASPPTTPAPAASSTRCSPTCSVKKDVNSGDRTGVRWSFLMRRTRISRSRRASSTRK